MTLTPTEQHIALVLGLKEILSARDCHPSVPTLANCAYVVAECQEDLSNAWDCAKEICLATSLRLKDHRFAISTALLEKGYFSN